MIKAILTDLEGTLFPRAFLRNTLERYASERMGDFVRRSTMSADVDRIMQEMRRLAGKDLSRNQVVQQLLHWEREGMDTVPLALLRALIWKDGLRRGELIGEVYPEAASGVRQWAHEGVEVYTFSAIPVEVQRLLLASTDAGDLTTVFSGYFDTRVGSRDDPTAYQSIATSIGRSPAEVMVVADAQAELNAARQIGMYTTWIVRDGAGDLEALHPQSTRFEEIPLR